jgi:hypothetical protein
VTGCPSDLRLELYAFGVEHSQATSHIESCSGCQRRLEEMQEATATFRREVYPATRERILESGRGWRRAFDWLQARAPVPVLAAGAAALLLAKPAGPPGDYVGAKGGSLGMTVFAQTVDGAQPLADGSPVPASAALRFHLSVAGPCKLWLVSVDETATVSRLYPAAGDSAATISAAGPLPGGAVLDGNKGPERIFAVCAPEPMPFAELERAVRKAAAGGPEAVRRARPLSEVPGGTSQVTLLIEKV